jgi:transcriptional regulator with XRE-family HTH domain
MRAAREARGLTQDTLAGKVGVRQSTISKLERGDHIPLGDTLALLCVELGLSPGDLLETDGQGDEPEAPTSRAVGE